MRRKVQKFCPAPAPSCCAHGCPPLCPCPHGGGSGYRCWAHADTRDAPSLAQARCMSRFPLSGARPMGATRPPLPHTGTPSPALSRPVSPALPSGPASGPTCPGAPCQEPASVELPQNGCAPRGAQRRFPGRSFDSPDSRRFRPCAVRVPLVEQPEPQEPLTLGSLSLLCQVCRGLRVGDTGQQRGNDCEDKQAERGEVC